MPNLKHGHSSRLKSSPTYNSWKGLKRRCKKDSLYIKNNITYSSSWEIFENFLADMGERPKNTSIDRIDNKKGYFKENCRWATPKQQARNRSSNKNVLLESKSICITEASELLNIKRDTVSHRINNMNMSIEQAISPNNFLTGSKKGKSKSNYRGVSFDTATNKWRVRFTSKKIKYSLGYFISEIDAARAYDRKTLELFGEFAKINFPREDYI